MAIDNELYSRLADSWWGEDTALCLLRLLFNPCRFGYFREILQAVEASCRKSLRG
jgi:2-polyprenyl-6-hydroxyphenyl methylase / 3-demethylubiquinone-9 3-methyltransferase